jgi:hypothetical protein
MVTAPRDQKFRWVQHCGCRLYDVGILADGTLHNNSGHSDELVREAVLAAIERQRQYRHERAMKGAATRAKRRELKISSIAKKILDGWNCGPGAFCVVCGKAVSDPESISRSIGSDCWGRILERITEIEAARREGSST